VANCSFIVIQIALDVYVQKHLLGILKLFSAFT